MILRTSENQALGKTPDSEFDCLKCFVLMYQCLLVSSNFLKGRMLHPRAQRKCEALTPGAEKS